MARSSVRALALALSLSTAAAATSGCVAVGATAAAAGVTGIVVGVGAHRSSCDSEGCIYNNLASLLLISFGAALTIGGGAMVYAGLSDE